MSDPQDGNKPASPQASQPDKRGPDRDRERKPRATFGDVMKGIPAGGRRDDDRPRRDDRSAKSNEGGPKVRRPGGDRNERGGEQRGGERQDRGGKNREGRGEK